MSEQEHSAAVKAVAADYRDRGYEILDTNNVPLPGVARRYEPDFVARRGSEMVAVEVKLRPTLSQSKHLRDMAEAYSRIPGWRLDIAVPGLEPSRREGHVLSRAAAASRLKIADQAASEAGDVAAALLLVWTVIEAALLEAVGEEVRGEPLPALRLLKTAYSLGHLSKADWETLERLCRLRNEVAHGRSPRRITRSSYRAARRVANSLLAAARHRRSHLASAKGVGG